MLNNNTVLKSPSDTTLYAPALIKDTAVTPAVLQKIKNFKEVVSTSSRRNSPVVNVIDQISTFVDNMRIRADQNDRRRDDSSSTAGRVQEEAKRESERVIVEAEKFKASLTHQKVRMT